MKQRLLYTFVERLCFRVYSRSVCMYVCTYQPRLKSSYVDSITGYTWTYTYILYYYFRIIYIESAGCVVAILFAPANGWIVDVFSTAMMLLIINTNFKRHYLYQYRNIILYGSFSVTPFGSINFLVEQHIFSILFAMLDLPGNLNQPISLSSWDSKYQGFFFFG